MIYQWNEQTYAFAKKYGALWEIQRDTKIPMDDVIKAMKDKRPIEGFYYTRTPMIDLDKTMKERKLRNNVKMSLMISEELVDQFIKAVGQRNKQDIIRGLISEWVKKEKKVAVANSLK
jgi:hypothetical protein